MESTPGRPPYLPIHALPHWGTIGPFVQAAVADTLEFGVRSERELFAAATPMVLWCWRARGTPLLRERIFTTTMVDQFIHLGMPGAALGSQATLRSTLWRMVEILNPEGTVARHRRLPRSTPTQPYSDADVAELYAWANTQTTPVRSRNALALLCLGLGAGLATRELLEVRASDVTYQSETSDRWAASVVVWRDRPRVVPVHSDWTRSLETILITLKSDEWLFRPGRTSTSPGQVTDFLTRSRSALDIRPARMRTTWIVRHLAEGTPANDLLQIAGLKNYAALDKHRQFL